jgi:hypothetical protein
MRISARRCRTGDAGGCPAAASPNACRPCSEGIGFVGLQGIVSIEEKASFRPEPYRKLLSASYGVPLCQPQIVPDRMQRLSDKLDCNSSATAVAGDTRLYTAHICGIRHANFLSYSLQ